ncbi:MAG: sulfatase-like hydrolase/transferase, partial [Planctomycetes bacterium]|nr:sulfatase-like hydrolase/transferase [Planctomycetota bacterium]
TLRVPLIVSWPGHLRKGEVSADLVDLVDLYPTLLDLCNCPAPKAKHPLQGKVISEHLVSGASVGRDYSVSENWGQCTVITERYKLGVWLDAKTGKRTSDPQHIEYGDMLFDRMTDPEETKNLINDPALAEVKAKLYAMFEEWVANTSDEGRAALQASK